MELDGGRLNKRVLIQLGTEVEDDAGDTKTRWRTVARRWAEIKPVSAARQGAGSSQGTTWQGEQAQMHRRSVVTFRFYRDLGPRHRLVRKGRVLAIEAIRDLEEANVAHELVVTEALDLVGSGARNADVRCDFQDPFNSQLLGAIL